MKQYPNVHDYLVHAAKHCPHKNAVVCEDQRLTYSELNNISSNLAFRLMELGMQPQDRVIIYLENSIESVISIYGILKALGVFVVANPALKFKQLHYLLNDSGATVLITDTKKINVVKKAINGLAQKIRIIWTGDYSSIDRSLFTESFEWNACISPVKNQKQFYKETNDDQNLLAGLIYTSGSTGNPKGIISAHRNIISAASSIITYLQNDEHDIILNVLPLSFDYGLYQIFMSVMFCGTVVLEKHFMFPHTVLKRIRKEKVTGFPVMPTLVNILLNMENLDQYDISSLRYLTSTGDVLQVQQIKKLRTILPNTRIYSMFGLTECKRVSYLDPNQLDVRPESVGKAMPGCEVMIIDEYGKEVEHGTIGELVVRGPNVMLGYWNDEELTKKHFRKNEKTGETILYSGDYFWMDEEKYLYFFGRKDSIIKVKGNRISTKEIESVIGGIDGVINCVVVGIADNTFGHSLTAYVVIEKGKKITDSQILQHCSHHLEPFKVPSTIKFVTLLPQTAHGKFDRKKLELI